MSSSFARWQLRGAPRRVHWSRDGSFVGRHGACIGRAMAASWGRRGVCIGRAPGLREAPRHAQWPRDEAPWCPSHVTSRSRVSARRARGPWRGRALSLRAVVASHPLKPAIQQRTGSDERWARAEDGDCLAKTVVDRAVPIAFAAQSDVRPPTPQLRGRLHHRPGSTGFRARPLGLRPRLACLPTLPARASCGSIAACSPQLSCSNDCLW